MRYNTRTIKRFLYSTGGLGISCLLVFMIYVHHNTLTPILKQVGQSPSSLLRVGLNPNERHTNLPATSLNHVRYKNNKTIDVIKIKTPVRDSGSLYKVNNNNNRNNKMNKTSKEKKAIAIGKHQAPNPGKSKEENMQKKIEGARDFLKHAQFNVTSSIPVLLVTYMRSGSSWLGSITSKAPGTFYLWEPLMHLIDEGYITNGSVCMNNDICRKPKEDHESHHVILISLFQLFTCDLENVHAKILTNLRSRIGSSCIKNIQTVYTVTNNTKHGNTSITKADRNTRNKRAIQRGASQPQRRPTFNDCLKVKKEECQNAQYRVIKTIRVSMSVAQILMELIPNLKIIHLVRDARAITNSRLHERVFKLTKDTSAHSKGLCNQIYNDISVGQTLKHLYAERITTVSYEHLAERPNEVAKSIFNFLGVQYDKNIDEWLHKSTHAQKDNGFYGTLRTNSSNVASHWRKELSFDKVEIIQKNCEQVLQSLGYISFKTVKELRSLNISARVTPLIDGFM